MDQSKKVFSLLDQAGINYRVIHHPPVYTADQADKYVQGEQFARTKNLFLTNKHHTHNVLLLLDEKKRFNAHDFKQLTGLGRLSFASDEFLHTKLGIHQGAVSPFSLLNNDQHDVLLYVDADVAKSTNFGGHPNDNTMTVILATQDLLTLLKQQGFEPHIIQIS